ncbi:MAG TPA: hypothetical protein VNN07_02135 [Candidatus Tectomicrobia bacterium]|nr:hypothetical protein [Candidatus Tectomicrobia bacterium]
MSYEKTLLSSATGLNDGQWIPYVYHPASVDVSGITTATVQIRGSNDEVKPDDATHGRQLGTDVTADAIVLIPAPVKWIKARVTAYTAGSITARLCGARAWP